MLKSTTSWSALTLHCLLWTLLHWTLTASLQCYHCDSTIIEDHVHVANIDCLVNGSETTCPPYQDRCYSFVSGESTLVEKGCTGAENCVGNRICCQTDYCNAGYGADLQTGFGQPCAGEASCVQGSEGMECRRETTAAVDQLPRCLCADGWFPLGAACVRQSGVGEVCYEDSHCGMENSYCQHQRCQCAQDFYPNHTALACVLKLPLLSECSRDAQCRSPHSVCAQRCVCQVGYLYNQVSGLCSGTVQTLRKNCPWTVVSAISIVLSIGQLSTLLE